MNRTISIRTKLFLFFITLVLLLIIVNLVLNSSILSRYYFNQDKNYLIDKVEQIKNRYSGDISDIEFELKELSNIDNIMVLVYSKSTNEPILLSINTINFEDSRYYSQLEDYYYEKEDLIFDQFLATEMGITLDELLDLYEKIDQYNEELDDSLEKGVIDQWEFDYIIEQKLESLLTAEQWEIFNSYMEEVNTEDEFYSDDMDNMTDIGIYESINLFGDYDNFDDISDIEKEQISLDIVHYYQSRIEEMGVDDKSILIDNYRDMLTMEVIYRLNKDDFIVIEKMDLINKESLDSLTTYQLLTALIIFLIGSLGVYYISSRFSKPIKELNSMTKEMAKFNFKSRHKIVSRDEIGELGESINRLSFTLENKIHKLNEAIIREKKIDIQRREFISNASHELKSPIALIKNYTQGLKLNIVDGEKKDFYCSVIEEETERLNGIVNELLDLALTESPLYELQMTSFSLNELLELTLSKMEKICAEKKISITIKNPEKICVKADKKKIEQVITNILNNAVDFISGENRIEIYAVESDSRVIVEIFNTGNQLSEVGLNKVWDRFYKEDKARKRSLGGTGLGLSIVKNILDHHNSVYGVKNMSNGVLFYFDLEATI